MITSMITTNRKKQSFYTNPVGLLKIPTDLNLTKLKNLSVNEIYPPHAYVELRVKSAKALFPTKFNRIEFVEPSAEEADGWSLRDRGYEWKKTARGNTVLSLFTRLHPDYITNQLKDYDQLVIDYKGLPGFPICELDVHISTLVESENSDKKLFSAHQYETFSDTERFNIIKKIGIIDSKPRDNLYLLGRALRLAPDEVWRYFGKGDRFLLQRRFNEDISELDVIEMVGPQGWPLSRVNFSVRFGSPSSPSQIIEMPVFLRPTLNVDGNLSVKLNFKSFLAKAASKGLISDTQIADNSKIYLDEVFLYFYGDHLKYKNDSPEFLMNFATFKNPVKHNDLSITEIPFIEKKISGTSYRKILNLSNFKLIRHNYRSNISLKLKPSANTDRCRVQFSDIYFIRSELSEQPINITRSSMWNEKLDYWSAGIPPLLTNGEFQQPGILSITSFDNNDRSLGSSVSKYSNINNNFFDLSLASLKMFRTMSVGLNGSSNTTAQGFKNDFNNTFGTIETVPNDYFGYHELQRGDSSTLSYPLDVLVGSTSLVYLEAKRHLIGTSEIDIAFLTSNGTRLNRKIALNTPLQLFDSSVKLSGFEIHSKDSKNLSNLRNIIFYQPSTQSIESSMNIMLPSAMSYRPKIVMAGETSPLESLGKVNLLIDKHTSNTFFTIIESPVQRLRGFTLNYWLDVSDSDMQSMQLNLDIKIGDKIIERKFKLNKAYGNIFIPFLPIRNSSLLPLNITEPVGAKWSVESLSATVQGNKTIRGQLEFKINTINIVTARDYFNADTPIFTSNNGEFSVRSFHDSISPDPNGRLHYWGTIESAAINRLISSINTLLPVFNDVFDVARVLLVSSAPNSVAQLLKHTPNDDDYPNGWYLHYWPSFLFMLIVFLIKYDILQLRCRLYKGFNFSFSWAKLHAYNLVKRIEFDPLAKCVFSRRTVLWLFLAIVLSSFFGLMQADPRQARNFFSLASLFCSIMIFVVVKVNESNFKKGNFRLIRIAYVSTPRLFWACCLLCILCIALLKSVGMYIVAEQFGSIALWLLIFGIVSAFIPKSRNAG